jgi:hypothetical protein
VSQVSFGASVEGKLHEGYVFGQDYTFQVAVSKVEVPTDPCTNHRLLNDENAERIYGWIRSTNIVRAQISPMIRHIRSACVDIATEAVDAGTLTAEEYDSVFSKWKAQVVLYDEPQLYVELSRQVRIYVNSFWCYLHMWILKLRCG